MEHRVVASVLLLAAMSPVIADPVLRQAPRSDSGPQWPAPALMPWMAAFLPDPVEPGDRQCIADSRLLLQHLNNHTAWATRMLDASGAGSSGVLMGTTAHTGDFDECLGLHWPHVQAAPVQPQYCVVNLESAKEAGDQSLPRGWTTADDLGPFANTKAMLQGSGQHWAAVPLGRLHLGLCVPASCSPSTVSRAAHWVAQQHVDQHTWTAHVHHPLLCTRREHALAGTDTRRCLVAAILALLVLIVVGTVMDPSGETKLSTESGWRLLGAFSLQRHLKPLLERPIQRESNIPALGGYHALVSIMAVNFHFFIFKEALPLGGSIFTNQRSVLHMWLQDNVHSGMTHFFFMSGFLMVAGSRKRADLDAVVRRVKRFLPSVAFFTFLEAVVGPHLSNGPIWRFRMEPVAQQCRSVWWANLLFVSNTRGLTSTNGDVLQCGLHLWSMSADMQCYALCCLGLWLWSLRGSESRWRGRVLGAGLSATLAVLLRVAITYLSGWTYVANVDHEFFLWPETSMAFWPMHMSTAISLLPYVMGAVFASLLQPLLSRGPGAKRLGLGVQRLLVGCTFALHAWRAFHTYCAWWSRDQHVKADDAPLQPLGDALAATGRQLLTCSIIALQFVGLDSRLSETNVWQRMLGSRAMVVLHRLTYLVYNVQGFIINSRHYSGRHPPAGGALAQGVDSAMVVVQSFALALLLELTVFGPTASLRDALFTSPKNTTKNYVTEHSTNPTSGQMKKQG